MRIQLELPEEKVRQLKGLMDEAGIKTYRELFDNALSLLNWSVREVRAGCFIASVDEVGRKYKELIMPILTSLSRRGASIESADTNPQKK